MHVRGDDDTNVFFTLVCQHEQGWPSSTYSNGKEEKTVTDARPQQHYNSSTHMVIYKFFLGKYYLGSKILEVIYPFLSLTEYIYIYTYK